MKSLIYITSVLITLSLFSCSDDDDDTINNNDITVYQIATANESNYQISVFAETLFELLLNSTLIC